MGGGGGGDRALIGGKALHRGALSSAIEQELKKKQTNKQYSWKKKKLLKHMAIKKQIEK